MAKNFQRHLMISRKAFVVAGGLALVLISGLVMALPPASAQSTVSVTIPSGAGSAAAAAANAPGFTPENVTVVIGVNNTVTWTNDDTAGAGTVHTVTPKTQPTGGNWPTAGSGNIAPSASYSFTFTVPGTYDYYCSYHSWMAGSVVVEAASTTTSTHTTPEFPAAWLAVILFAVIAAVILVAPRLRPTLPAVSGTGRSRAV